MSTYINEGTNIDIGVEFNKIRLEIVKDKAAFNTAIRNKDYKTARYIAYKINKKCDEFYDKLEKLDITKSEAVIGTLAKATYDAGITVAAIAGTMELVIKSVEVNKGVDFTKSQKQRIRNAVYKDNESKSVLAGVIAAGALEGTVNMLLKLYNKISNSKDIEPKDLNAYYVTIKQKMKVICAKAKLLPNQVDILEKRYGAEEKRKELEKNVKDSKNMLNESEEAIMDRDLLDVVVESDINEIKESDPEILAVYKECAEGHITEGQREDIITSIRNQRSASAIIEEAQVDEDSTLKDKFNEIKRIAYERCENGEFSEDTREEIINAAYNKLFNATEEVDIDKAEPVKDNPAETKKEIDEMNKNIDKEMNANKA